MFVKAGEVGGLSHWSGWIIYASELSHQQEVIALNTILHRPTVASVSFTFCSSVDY